MMTDQEISEHLDKETYLPCDQARDRWARSHKVLDYIEMYQLNLFPEMTCHTLPTL